MDSLNNKIMTNKSIIDKSKLIQLATSEDNSNLINDLLSKDIPTQIKAFRMLSSKADLIRLIQLKDSLEKLENAYIERALEDSNDMDIASLGKVIELVSKSVIRTNDSINKLTQDEDKLSININNTLSNNDSNQVSVNSVSIVTDKSSRDKLRTIMSKVMASVSKNNQTIVNASPSNLDNVIDVSPD